MSEQTGPEKTELRPVPQTYRVAMALVELSRATRTLESVSDRISVGVWTLPEAQKFMQDMVDARDIAAHALRHLQKAIDKWDNYLPGGADGPEPQDSASEFQAAFAAEQAELVQVLRKSGIR